MAYRYPSEQPPNPEDMLQKYVVRNGATLKLAFRCYYVKPKPGHDPHYHDYKNWPAPNYHPGNICQMLPPRDLPRYIHEGDMRMAHPDDLVPIHLIDEGYSEAVMVFEDTDNDDYITAETWIDQDDDNIVRVHANTAFPNFSEDAKELRFTVFVKKVDNVANRTTQDAVAHGVIVITPGHPYPTA